MNTINLTIEDDDGYETEIHLPAHYIVCPRCEGNGTHNHPDIGGNGFTSSEWDECCAGDPDFPEEYFRGTYDVQCTECKGARVILDVDEDRFTDIQRKAWEDHCQHLFEMHQERRYQERMGF